MQILLATHVASKGFLLRGCALGRAGTASHSFPSRKHLLLSVLGGQGLAGFLTFRIFLCSRGWAYIWILLGDNSNKPALVGVGPVPLHVQQLPL